MEFIGNINPESINAGRKPALIATILAKNWFFNSEEIFNPIPSDVKRNRLLTKNRIK